MSAGAAAFDRVEARQVSRVYGRERALAPLDLCLRAGESVGLAGPNGAGKSTLLGMLATLIRPTTGQVLFAGKQPGAAERAAIGLVAHDTMCYGDLSGRENLEFFARLYRVAGEQRRVGSLIERLGLEDAADRPMRGYSRGLRQRLAIARALLHAPRLLLLDEPFAGLDLDGALRLQGLLDEQREQGAILVLVSHEIERLARLTRRLLILRRGHLAYDGPTPGEAPALAALYRRLVDEKCPPSRGEACA